MRIIRTIGNKSLWQREKTLFLTSRMAPLGCYENVFRWVESFDRWQCAVCFNTSEHLPVYLLLGIGGQPIDPDILYLTPFTPKLTVTDILKTAIQANQLIDSIISRFPKPSHPKINHMQQEKMKHHNAYARWSEDDDTHLRQLFLEGKTVKELMTVFERNRGGITSRLRKLNFI